MQYDCKMRYVPPADAVKIPGIKEEPQDGYTHQDVASAAMNAIESMMCMCAMVYMKCMQPEDPGKNGE